MPLFSGSHLFGKIKKGTRFEALTDIATEGLIHWNAPMTTGFQCVIPRGTILVVLRESSSCSLGFACVPENRSGFEERFVPEADRQAEKYAGYSFVFTRLALGRRLKPI